MWQFEDILKPTIWGGNSISGLKGHKSDVDGIGESWELSGVEGSLSVVADGPDKNLTLRDLVEKYGARMMGQRNFSRYGYDFPILIKFIDAKDNLSIQVHPDDEVAKKHGNSVGKTEMWYVIHTEPGSSLINGFKEPVNPDDFDKLVDGTGIIDVCRNIPVKPGDVFLIPAGRIHSIGKGILLAEIQQTSDLTYRIFDYHRKDKDGKERQLHTDLAREAIDFNDVNGEKIRHNDVKNIPVNLVSTLHFTTNLLNLNAGMIRDYSEWDTFVVLICTDGAATIEEGTDKRHLSRGHTVLIPASSKGISILPDPEGFSALEVYLK